MENIMDSFLLNSPIIFTHNFFTRKSLGMTFPQQKFGKNKIIPVPVKSFGDEKGMSPALSIPAVTATSSSMAQQRHASGTVDETQDGLFPETQNETN